MFAKIAIFPQPWAIILFWRRKSRWLFLGFLSVEWEYGGVVPAEFILRGKDQGNSSYIQNRIRRLIQRTTKMHINIDVSYGVTKSLSKNKVSRFGHTEIVLATLRSFWPHWDRFGHTEIVLVTLRSFWPHWDRFGHTEIVLVTLRSFSSHWDRFGHTEIVLVTLRSFWSHWDRFGHIEMSLIQIKNIHGHFWHLVSRGAEGEGGGEHVFDWPLAPHYW